MTEVRKNEAAHRYELEVAGALVVADYRMEGDTLFIHYVEAPPALRGTGAAGQLMQGMLALAREEGLKVVPVCGYAASWIRRHKEFHDLLAARP